MNTYMRVCICVMYVRACMHVRVVAIEYLHVNYCRPYTIGCNVTKDAMVATALAPLHHVIFY